MTKDTPETIGKCEYCINTVDKEEILFALNDMIDKRNRELERIKKEMIEREIKLEDRYKHPTMIIYETHKRRTENVKKRVENTPEC